MSKIRFSTRNKLLVGLGAGDVWYGNWPKTLIQALREDGLDDQTILYKLARKAN